MKLESYLLLLLSILATNAAPIGTSNQEAGAVASSNPVLLKRGLFSRKKSEGSTASSSGKRKWNPFGSKSSKSDPSTQNVGPEQTEYDGAGTQTTEDAGGDGSVNTDDPGNAYEDLNQRLKAIEDRVEAIEKKDGPTNDGSTGETTGPVEDDNFFDADDGNSVPVGRRIRASAARASQRVREQWNSNAAVQRVNNAARATGERVKEQWNSRFRNRKKQ